MTSSPERVDNLMALSEVAYPAIDERFHGQDNSRIFVRLGMQTLATMVQEGHGEGLVAGDYLQSLLWHRLEQGSMDVGSALQPWPEYAKTLDELPPVLRITRGNPKLDTLARAYSDVRRATTDANDAFETDARHVMHLSTLSLPYAAKHYPDLDRSRLAIYNLVHDIVEAYAGDTPSLGMSADTADQKHEREQLALERIVRELSKTHSKLARLIVARENVEDDEARFSKAFDKLDPKFPTIASEGLVLRRNYAGMDKDRYAELNHTQAEVIRFSYGVDYSKIIDDFLELSKRASEATWPSNIAA